MGGGLSSSQKNFRDEKPGEVAGKQKGKSISVFHQKKKRGTAGLGIREQDEGFNTEKKGKTFGSIIKKERPSESLCRRIDGEVTRGQCNHEKSKIARKIFINVLSRKVLCGKKSVKECSRIFTGKKGGGGIGYLDADGRGFKGGILSFCCEKEASILGKGGGRTPRPYKPQR